MVDGSGLNEKSKGWAVGSDCRWSGVSMLRHVFGRMNQAAARVVDSVSAKPLTIMLCALFLLFLPQEKAWSP